MSSKESDDITEKLNLDVNGLKLKFESSKLETGKIDVSQIKTVKTSKQNIDEIEVVHKPSLFGLNVVPTKSNP